MKRKESERKYFFDDYKNTELVYHIANISDLKEIVENGLKVNMRSNEKYAEFNSYFDMFKPGKIPDWVSRRGAIYGSLNFGGTHYWHSHSVLLAFKINEEQCWIGNEELANILYEPFILKDAGLFNHARDLVVERGNEYALNYWNNSLSFKENLLHRRDLEEGFDAEVLIMHDIPPQDINIVKIASDHYFLDTLEWDEMFLKMRYGRASV